MIYDDLAGDSVWKEQLCATIKEYVISLGTSSISLANHTMSAISIVLNRLFAYYAAGQLNPITSVTKRTTKIVDGNKERYHIYKIKGVSS